MSTTVLDPKAKTKSRSRADFETGLWTKNIDVRNFIQQNYQPYDGDGSFLKGATARTEHIWDILERLFVEERKKGVLDVSQIPSSIIFAESMLSSSSQLAASSDSRSTER